MVAVVIAEPKKASKKKSAVTKKTASKTSLTKKKALKASSPSSGKKSVPIKEKKAAVKTGGIVAEIKEQQKEDSLKNKKLKALVKEQKSAKTKDKSSEELTLRKARLVEKYIRQGKSWEEILKNIENFAQAYSMRKEYEARTVIDHSSLGLGYVMAANNNRMTVYFEDGYRNLIMNYGK